ncbi:MAG: hypothetical protein KGQ54_04080, partial [Verrucomicrobia bacterium]|nr:hypothetical protein [Verrucomicrobiota bacterium]
MPQKNLRLLGGIPLVVHTIQAAQKSQIFEKVWVSTEDPKIADIASAANAGVHQRPPFLSGDLVSSTEVCLDMEN